MKKENNEKVGILSYPNNICLYIKARKQNVSVAPEALEQVKYDA